MERDRQYPSIGQAILLLGGLLFFQLAVGVIEGVALAAVAMATGYEISPSEPFLVTLTLLAAYVPIVFWGVWRTGLPFRRLFPFTRFPVGLLLPLLPAIVGYGILCSEADNLLLSLVPMPKFIYELFRSLHTGGVAGLAVIALAAPFAEEMVFRGLILGGFLERYRVWKALLVSAALFAVVHVNPYQFFTAFGLGLLMAWLFWRTGSLWLCAIVHGLHNSQGWVAENVLRLDVPGYASRAETAAGTAVTQFQPLWFDLLGVAMLVGGLVVLGLVARRWAPTCRRSARLG